MKMHVCLLLLSCIAFLQLEVEVTRGAAGKEEENIINPFDLARQLRSEICGINESQIQEFYKSHREEENRDRQFPAVDPVTQLQTLNQRRTPISWSTAAVWAILEPYMGTRLGNVTLDLFTWCVFPLSITMEIYGCINSTDRWGSPDFRALGLLDIMSLTEHKRFGHKRGRLELETESKNAIHLSVLRGALVSCTISVPDGSTVGIYFHLDLSSIGSRGSALLDISRQADAFLVEGQPKNFTCVSVGDDAAGHRWYHRETGGGEYDFICHDVYSRAAENCNDSSFYQLIIKKSAIPGCDFVIAEGFEYQSVNSTLVIVSPTVNDTGEIKCNSDKPPNGHGRSLYIAVVFTELPLENIHLNRNTSSLLACEMKAPSDAMVYWTKKLVQNEECRVPILNDAPPKNYNDTDSVLLCNTTVVANKTVEKVDNTYSLFRLELQFVQIPEANFEHHDTYSCNVKYKIDSLTEPQLIQQSSNVFIIDQDEILQEEKEEGLSKAQIAMSVVGSFIFCFLVGTIITVSLVVWVKSVKRSKLRGRRIARLPKGHLSIKYSEVSLLSPGVVKGHRFEFPRSNLELQDIIGEGRFGKVYKGKAYGIVPDAPDLNTVAVKTTATDQLHTCTQQLLSELDILTKIQPHENICNLLASCTSPDGPLYVIMEYACHGNLKDYLEKCRETLLQRSIPVRIVSEEERSHFWQLLISCDSEGSEANSPSQVTDAIQFTVPNPIYCDPESNLGYDHLDQESPCTVDGEREVMVWSTGYDRLASKEDSNFSDSALDNIVCGDAAFNYLITELNIRDFARQIANGLQHLEDMNIVHCDLAARNILIAEGFLLKIGDFGMARCMASDARYQRLQSNEGSMVAIKWAALEVLAEEIYSFKSDIWSFATIIWEIATYGSKPFAGFAIGASVEPFVQYLKDGNRVPQPDGLSDSFYEELCSCWSADPNSRPSASSLVDYFQVQKESSGSLGEQDDIKNSQ